MNFYRTIINSQQVYNVRDATLLGAQKIQEYAENEKSLWKSEMVRTVVYAVDSRRNHGIEKKNAR